MSRLLSIVLLVALTCSAQEKKEPTLKVGDAAPPFQVGKWLKGAEVKHFEAGKVYVVEFWATWCGPCIGVMPHLASLQAEYKDKGVSIVGFTSRDLLGLPDHSEKEVANFMEKRGKNFGYSFAYSDDNTIADAWLGAAGRKGIPCSFVVDKSGRIAFIGHPMYLPAVLPKVVEGVATAKQVGDDMGKLDAEVREISTRLSSDPKAGLKAIDQFDAKYPTLVDFLPWVRTRLSYLPKHGEPGEAKKYAEALIARAIEKKDVQSLGMTSGILRRGDGKDVPELRAVAVRASEAEVRLDGGQDARSLINLADAHFVNGDKVKAREFAIKAKAAMTGESAALRRDVEKEAARLIGE